MVAPVFLPSFYRVGPFRISWFSSSDCLPVLLDKSRVESDESESWCQRSDLIRLDRVRVRCSRFGLPLTSGPQTNGLRPVVFRNISDGIALLSSLLSPSLRFYLVLSRFARLHGPFRIVSSLCFVRLGSIPIAFPTASTFVGPFSMASIIFYPVSPFCTGCCDVFLCLSLVPNGR